MPTTLEGRRLTTAHRQAQAATQQSFLTEFLAVWALLNVADLDTTTPNWLRAAMRVIEEFRQESADLTLGYVRRLREVEAPDAADPLPDVEFVHEGGPRVTLDLPRRAIRVPAARPGRPRRRVQLLWGDQAKPVKVHWRDRDPSVEASLRVTGPVEIKRRIKLGETPERARRNAAAHAAGAGIRHVGDGSRDTTLTVIENDRQALGWIRAARSNCCAFCAMLSSRGLTYNRYNKKSFAASDIKFKGDPRDDDAITAKVHDNCKCTLIPIWVENDPALDLGKQWRQLWNEHISGQYSGKAAINAWRRLHERPELFLSQQANHQQAA